MYAVILSFVRKMKFFIYTCAALVFWCHVAGRESDDACRRPFTHPEDSSAVEDAFLNMTELVKKYGYPIETHTVQTKDGYILTMYRIPHGRKCGPVKETKMPVLLQHGLLSSSFDFLILGPRKALGYLLADRCYDVWLGNSRGNGESKKHIWMKPNQRQFWTFSWHEMGKYDLPAVVDYILNTTGQPNLHYVGHSQGTTQFFVFGALYPEYHHKIRSMHALSPVAYMKGLASPILRILTLFLEPLEKIAKIVGLNEIFPSKTFLNFLGSEICKNKYPQLQGICCNVMFLLCGFDEPQLNKTILPAIVGHTPAGSGVKQFIHYAQGIKSGEFRQFDYGEMKNLEIYKQKVPPKYDVGKINIPVAFYYGANDFLAAVKDVKKLEVQMPNLVEKYLVPYPKFNHIDFLFATDVKQLVYSRLMELLEMY